MTPIGAVHLLSLRLRGYSVSPLFVRLDADWDEVAPQWWLRRGYSVGDWWLHSPEILIGSKVPIARLDLRAVGGMSVIAVQHGGSEERMTQLCARLFACGAKSVISVSGQSVMAMSDGGRKIAA